MNNRQEIRDFLATRRARITPQQAGLPNFGGYRRVPGLRREEAAMLAGVSVDYYTRLERGGLNGASDSVLEALARALQLDEAERAHLFDLARAAHPGPGARPPASRRIRPALQQVLDAISGVPALIRNGRLDYLAANRLGRALYAPLFDSPAGPPNSARFVFLDPRAPEFYGDWDRSASDIVAILRTQAGRTTQTRPCPTSSASCPPAAISSALVGRPQRPPAPDRHQSAPPPRRRGPGPGLGSDGTVRRPWPDPAHLQHRTAWDGCHRDIPP